VARVRLDTLLAERGLFESRSRAAASVMAGEVRIGGAGERAAKPGQLVDPDVVVAVDERPRYVSRGGVKLANALAAFGDLSVAGRSALDVAYGELDWRLRNDPRVTVLERVNARGLRAADLPYAPDLVVADLSFISLTKVLPALLRCVAPRFDVLAMVKPQFEVGRERVGKGGVVRDADARRDALVAVASCARALGASVLGFASSGLPGPKGNLETFVRLAEAGRAGEVVDVESAARKVEP
jgi:23S rRNA (cytidine1920-2'-O)/16S rRNA (cytidine1409-2'-O)-methyltransferase